MSITGLPGQGPVRVGIPIADLCAGLLAAQGILVALLEREVSGEGQWVQTSLLQAQVFMLDFQAARWLVDGEVPKQAGNNHPTSIPTGVFATADGHINIAVAGQAIWQRFLEAIGHASSPTTRAYATGAPRSRNRDALNAALAAILRQRHQRAVDRAAERGGRALRADQHDRPGVRATRRCATSGSRSPCARTSAARSSWSASRS